MSHFWLKREDDKRINFRCFTPDVTGNVEIFYIWRNKKDSSRYTTQHVLVPLEAARREWINSMERRGYVSYIPPDSDNAYNTLVNLHKNQEINRQNYSPRFGLTVKLTL